VLVLIGITAEYLTYGGISQEIAMVAGLLAALTRPAVASTLASRPEMLRSAALLGT
jgi:hypothetical protein